VRRCPPFGKLHDAFTAEEPYLEARRICGPGRTAAELDAAGLTSEAAPRPARRGPLATRPPDRTHRRQHTGVDSRTGHAHMDGVGVICAIHILAATAAIAR